MNSLKEVCNITLNVHVINMAKSKSSRSWFDDFDFGIRRLSLTHKLNKIATFQVSLRSHHVTNHICAVA